MLNLFAATGHNNYAKTCRLYLQSITALESQHPLIFEQFMLGNHTVRRTEKIWSGIWTDLSIEQILMKSLKGRGGVIGRGMTDNVLRIWTKTMYRCAEVSDTLDKLSLTPNSSDTHKELLPGRIKRDCDDFVKIQSWFCAHNPFTTGDKLICLDSGLVDESNSVDCDHAEEIGASMQNTLDVSGNQDITESLPDNLRSKALLVNVSCIDFSLGEKVHIRGKIKMYRKMKEIVSDYAARVTNSSSEIFRMFELPFIYKNVYNCSFVLPYQVQKELELCEKEIKTGIKSQGKVMNELQQLIEDYLVNGKITCFSIQDIMKQESLIKVQEELGKDQPSNFLQNMLEAVIKTMELKGLVCLRSDKKNIYESLFHPKSELASIILDILKKETAVDKSNGCPYMKIMKELKNTVQYAVVRYIAVSRCLDQLETCSDVIKVTDTCFIPC